MSTIPAGQPPAPRTLWDHVRAWWRARRRPSAPPPATPVAPLEPARVSRAIEEPLVVLAKGDVYEFRVHAEMTWSAEAMTAETLRTRMSTYGDSARDMLRDKAWVVARTCLPHEAHVAEEQINEALKEGWCYRHNGVEIRCTPRVRVMPDDRVRQHLLPYWQKYLDIDGAHVIGERRAEQVGRQLAIWRELLATLTEDAAGIPLATHAARLTDGGFAAVLDGFVSENRSAAEELIAVLERAARTHERLGYFEFAESYDAALAGFKRQMRLPGQPLVVPAAGNGTGEAGGENG